MAKFIRKKFRRILIDIDTQVDLIFNEGTVSLTQPDSPQSIQSIQSMQSIEALFCHFRRLFAWARVRKIPVISTALSQRKDGVHIPTGVCPFCIEGTPGHPKIHFTMMPRNIQFGPENRLDLPRHLLTDYQQIIFEKRTHDPFVHPRADRLLTEIKADEFIVFGMGAENSVKATVLGLLNRRKKVLAVTDAIGGIGRQNVIMALRQMEAKGAGLIDTLSLTGKSKFSSMTGAVDRVSLRSLAHSRSN